MNKKLYASAIVFFILLFAGDLIAQTVKLTAEIRPRYEMRHGYKTLFPDNATAANFISQRTRFNGFFSNETFKAYVSLQDVRVWGDVDQLNKKDVNGLSVHEAWGQMRFCDVFSLKVGRQEIIYDDHRMFGSVGRAQQARSHDAAIFKFQFGDNNKLDFGIAYNAMAESLYEVAYTKNNYKTFQYIHYHGDFGKSGVSVLFLNNGLAYDADPDTTKYDEKVSYSQTIGARYTFNGKKVKANAAYYHQIGKNKSNNTLQAYYFSANIKVIVASWFNIGLGAEVLSGTSSIDQNISSAQDNSFTPFYGTNHKFNGWMDYFYVGNYNGQNGLTDIYLPLNFKVKKWNFGLIPHYFMAGATVSQLDSQSNNWVNYSNTLGTEIDFTVGYTLSKSASIKAGYSQMFATESMQVLKGGNYQNTNNWGWIMITFKPTLFDSNKKK